MHRVQQTIRVALYAAALAAFVDVSLGDPRLPLTCKNIARDVIMNSCKGSRIKRAPVALDQVKLDEEMKMGESDHKEHVAPQKRQWGFQNAPFGEYNSETLSSYHDTELQLPGVEFSDDRGTEFSENQFLSGGPGDYFAGTFGLGDVYFRAAGEGSKPVARSADSRDLLGYHLSPEELEELYQEIGERMPRNSKDLNKKIFLNVAAKCCPNVKLCYDNPSLIPCIMY
ncbi:uncharacterized protein LOC143375862 isoform X2 [Andrena cerasifolii]|uniref:uncharacterized protein LOC143375862 isoform X2 n=1 Tax=Andrena cerasifolii TaxID=2819439 RepID=UPI004037D7C1